MCVYVSVEESVCECVCARGVYECVYVRGCLCERECERVEDCVCVHLQNEMENGCRHEDENNFC